MTTNSIKTLEPYALWHWFEIICSIPHGSYNEERLACYIVDWAKSKNLWVCRDEVGNILIKKPASEGMQNRPTVALQAHLDMVTQANGDYDFKNNRIYPMIDGEWVTADGTTLGADNGIGMASCLAVLGSDIPHPNLEVLLTMTEEAGMEGVFGLKKGWLDSTIMINTDTEEAGEIYLGCAGGVDADFTLDLDMSPTNKSAVRLDIKGLKGGHSGLDIHKNNSNAIKLLARILASIKNDISLVSLSSGTARNAIPRFGFAVFVCDDVDKVFDKIKHICQVIKNEIIGYESNFVFEISQTNANNAISQTQTRKIIDFLNSLPNGVIRHSDVLEDTVETSLSSGVLRLCIDDEKGDSIHRFSLTTLIRSLADTSKEGVQSSLQSLADLAGIRLQFFGSYVGWSPDNNSDITQLTKKLYADILGYEPKLKVIHAGLECGLVKKSYPHMDIVSIGPTIKNAHSPDECVHIGSVQVYWDLLTRILANIPAKTDK